MSLKIEETFQLKAPVDQVWAYFSDPRQVVTCLPGAELTSVESETTFLGRVKVKVGPVTAAYNGKVTITERDDVAHSIRLVGDGRESSGGGSAKMTMTSTLVALPNGATEVRVTADLDVIGRLMQFGRGMIESVNKQMFKQFTDCLRATLETRAADAPAAVVPPPRSPPTGPSPSLGAGPVSASSIASVSPPLAIAPARIVAAREPVRIVPIVLRAAWENFVRVLAQLWSSIAKMLQRGG